MGCQHLSPLESELKEKGYKETFRGHAWGEEHGEWVYFRCILSLEKIKTRFNFPDCVKLHENGDERSGLESGFYCESCRHGVMGGHPRKPEGWPVFE